MINKTRYIRRCWYRWVMFTIIVAGFIVAYIAMANAIVYAATIIEYP